MADPNLSEIVSTTLRHRNKEFADNVSNGNALLKRLSQKGKIKLVDGGRTIVEELDYAENATFQYYSGYEAINISPSTVLSAAEFDWKQASVVVSASGLETRVQNAGKEKLIDLLESRITNAMRTFKNNLSTGIYSDGTGSSGKQVGGLQSLVALVPTSGTVGGIDRGTYTFWRNQTSGDVANIDTTYSTLESEMRDMWLETSRGNDKVDLIVADTTLFGRYWSGLTALQRFASADEAGIGFQSLKFNTADVVYDGDSGIRTNAMYFLNTDYISLKVHRETNMVALPQRESVNQDALIVPVLWAGNLTSSNCSLQGVVYT
jgi:hypothetical protein